MNPTVFVTDGGLETELVFHDGRDLPAFAAFPLLEQADGWARLRRYYDGYLDIARRHGTGFVVETPTWRANPDWAAQLGYSAARLDAVNRAAVELAEEVRSAAACGRGRGCRQRLCRSARRRLRPRNGDDHG
ncbi:homocysteine S-methyltransferase family protein [Mycobacterium sp. SMC-4]|uniref:homocysteine S-methyltransferase family protein n=1 Tax=Mycobacterium sp. SMC-4 TaxID=2857059 RepID=UPI003D025312